ncbi:MAG: ATP-binding protein [Muribaculaceae bacterium]|nr:ATP-binding protein [Muribaculaceae bacterium]
MKHLVIKNVGPIDSVDLNLKRFNIFIGPQSSGKSTIAKILSSCEWIEKEVATTRDENAIASGEDFKSIIESFHKVEDYFDNPLHSYVLFDTDCIKIEYKEKQLNIILKRNVDYHRQKICYIPAERNAATLPELNGYEFGSTNLKSFLFDWYRAREFYNPENKNDVLGLGVQYFYDKTLESKRDRIQHINGKTYDISLSSSSSGLQSVIPLLVMVQYYSSQYFQEYDFKNSFELDAKAKKTRIALTSEVALTKYKPGFKDDEAEELVKQFNEELHKGVKRVLEIFDEYEKACDRLLIPNRTTFIIEEPEQNLFPYTQVELIERIAGLCSKERKHGFTITTHSPFILNYVNVLILRFYKKTENKSVLNPDDLAVYATQEGRIIDLMQLNAKTNEWSVNAEDLVEVMREMLTEYKELKSAEK